MAKSKADIEALIYERIDRAGPNGIGKAMLDNRISYTRPELDGALRRLVAEGRVTIEPEPPAYPGRQGGVVCRSVAAVRRAEWFRRAFASARVDPALGMVVLGKCR